MKKSKHIKECNSRFLLSLSWLRLLCIVEAAFIFTVYVKIVPLADSGLFGGGGWGGYMFIVYKRKMKDY